MYALFPFFLSFFQFYFFFFRKLLFINAILCLLLTFIFLFFWILLFLYGWCYSFIWLFWISVFFSYEFENVQKRSFIGILYDPNILTIMKRKRQQHSVSTKKNEMKRIVLRMRVEFNAFVSFLFNASVERCMLCVQNSSAQNNWTTWIANHSNVCIPHSDTHTHSDWMVNFRIGISIWREHFVMAKWWK